jgi:hypothetical protein
MRGDLKITDLLDLASLFLNDEIVVIFSGSGIAVAVQRGYLCFVGSHRGATKLLGLAGSSGGDAGHPERAL